MEQEQPDRKTPQPIEPVSYLVSERSPSLTRTAHEGHHYLLAIISIVGVLVLVLGGVGYLYLSSGDSDTGAVIFEQENDETIVILPNEFKDWQTYRNEEYGFEFRYLNGIIIEETQNSHPLFEDPVILLKIPITNVPYDARAVGIHPQASEAWLIDTLGINKPTIDFSDSFFSNIENYHLKSDAYRGDIIIDGRDGLKIYSGEYAPVDYILFKNPDSTYFVISLLPFHIRPIDGSTPQYELDLEEAKGLFVSSLKFIDSSNFIGWQTYRNEEYGFEFVYPNSWGIIEKKDLKTIGLLPPDEEQKGNYYGDIHIYVSSLSIDEIRELYAYYDLMPEVTESDVGGVHTIIYRNIPRDIPGQSGYGEAYFILKGLNIVVRKFWNNNQGVEVFDQILSTFRFIE